MTILDFVLVVVWAGITLGGFFKGAIRIVFGLGGVALGIWLSVIVAPDLAVSLTGLVNSEWLTLILAGLAAVLVYTVRRYKTDDYRGYYRIWLWAAMCWFRGASLPPTTTMSALPSRIHRYPSPMAWSADTLPEETWITVPWTPCAWANATPPEPVM